MTTKYTIEDTFDVSAETFWDTFFSEEFNRALYAMLDVAWEQIELTCTGHGDTLKTVNIQRLTSNRELPALVKPFVDGKLSYTERSEFTARINEMKVVTTPSAMADKIKTYGTYRLEVLGEKRVKRIWEGTVECNIFLVGSKVEAMLVEEVQESYRKSTVFMREWLKAHAETERLEGTL